MEDHINTNLSAAAYLGYLIGQHMIDRSGKRAFIPEGGSTTTLSAVPIGISDTIGAIVHVGSRGAFRGEPFSWAYGASKAGLHTLAQNMAQALGKYGVTVNAVSPGFVATPFAASVLVGKTGEAITSQSPMHRVATPEEVAECVYFLAQFRKNPWVTGALLDCNGASYMRT
jgi:NAD(P)-dependent dehydrogenase (short-subunit alcohol dehydrogenase family)